ncbi:MAG: hypothetical protein AAGC55_08085, partial [Myxococcota bacterium]
TMCTDVSGACPLALAALDSGRFIEDPASSDGDGVLEPGEILLEVTFINAGSEDATDAVATLSSDSADVTLPEPMALPTIPAGSTVTQTFAVELSGEACGSDVAISVESQIATRTWARDFTFRPGILPFGEPETFASDAGYVNDDRNVFNGAWAHGVPQATFFAGRRLQPDGGADGAGDSAWLTGPFDSWNQGELFGEAVLQSAPIDMTGLYRPSLKYDLWYFAYDIVNQPGQPTRLVESGMDHLVISASSDGGATWVEVDRVTGGPSLWGTREVPLEGIDSVADVLLRFTAIDYEQSDSRLVEVGIDNISIGSLSQECVPVVVEPEPDVDEEPAGCGCQLPSDNRSLGGSAPAVLFGLATLLMLRRPRRRS